MENITFFVERYGVIAVFLNFWTKAVCRWLLILCCPSPAP